MKVVGSLGGGIVLKDFLVVAWPVISKLAMENRHFPQQKTTSKFGRNWLGVQHWPALVFIIL